jgi:hypothetical protein
MRLPATSMKYRRGSDSRIVRPLRGTLSGSSDPTPKGAGLTDRLVAEVF